jgi:ribose/xylose/arabinose/galactoside ABC-type transport system permease subunit
MIENFMGPAMPEVLITAGLDLSVGETAVLCVLQLSC